MGMPGSILSIPPDGDCEDCQLVPATLVMQGETDSWGYEEVHLCKACHEKGEKQEQDRRDKPQRCDWCKTTQTGVVLFRDPDEGSHGPVYMVCPTCRGKSYQSQEEELEYLRRQIGEDY